MPLDLNNLRKAGVSKKLAQTLINPTVSMRRVTTSTFLTQEVTTGIGATDPYTIYRATGWTSDEVTRMQPATSPEPPEVVCAPTNPADPYFVDDNDGGHGFAVAESGVYTLRFGCLIGFTSDVGTPPWVRYKCTTVLQNRPYVGIVSTQTGALAPAGNPNNWPSGSPVRGAAFDVTLPEFYQDAWNPDDPWYDLGVTFWWPGVGRTPSNALSGVYADLARVA